MEFLIILLALGLCVLTFLFYKKNQQINHLQLDYQQQMSQLQLDHTQHIQQLNIDFEKEKKNATQLSLSASRNTIKGQMSEKFCPFQSDFPYTPSDCTFLGKPFDFIVFNNIEKYRDNEEGITIDDIEVIFLEIKTGKSSLTKVEKAIKHAINHQRIRFETYRYNGVQSSPTLASSSTQNENAQISENLETYTPLDFIENDRTHRTQSNQPHIIKSRETYPRTLYKWSEYETDLLIQKYDEGHNLTELTFLFQRTEGGISSRLTKLGVEIQLDE